MGKSKIPRLKCIDLDILIYEYTQNVEANEWIHVLAWIKATGKRDICVLEFLTYEVFAGLLSQNQISLNDNNNLVVTITLSNTMLKRKVKGIIQGIQCFILPDKRFLQHLIKFSCGNYISFSFSTQVEHSLFHHAMSIHKPTLWGESAFLGNFIYNAYEKHVKSSNCPRTQNKTN